MVHLLLVLNNFIFKAVIKIVNISFDKKNTYSVLTIRSIITRNIATKFAEKKSLVYTIRVKRYLYVFAIKTGTLII
jgi:hypothetical protein